MKEKTAAGRARERFQEKEEIVFDEVSHEALPQAVLEKVGVSLPNIERTFRARLGGIEYYVCEYKPFATSRKAFFIDCDVQGKRIGFAILDYDTDNPTFGPTGLPYTNYTSTESGPGQGHGTARLYVMNAYAMKTFGLTMHSGSRLEPAAEAMWQGLIRDGIAEPVPSDILKSKYRIKKP